MGMHPRVRRPAPPALALLLALGLLWALAGGGCERRGTPSQQATPAAVPATTSPATAPAGPSTGGGAPDRFAQPPQSGNDNAPVILVLGDSLSAGHGLPIEEAYPSLIQQRLEAAGSPWRLVNAGVSGDTSAGGLARLDWLLKQRVDILVLELGANDGLRGQDPEAMRANLAKIIERAKARGITVVLTGMQMPSNYGADYQHRFAAVFPELARAYQLPFVPFLLQGVALHPELNQADGIHPNAEGARIVADNVWRVLKPLLDKG
jgi:acyl-CoA thioesterase I